MKKLLGIFKKNITDNIDFPFSFYQENCLDIFITNITDNINFPIFDFMKKIS